MTEAEWLEATEPGPMLALLGGEIVMWGQQGMSRPEVEAILGPPGDYRTAPGQITENRYSGLQSWHRQIRYTMDGRRTYPSHGWTYQDEGPVCLWLGDTAAIGVEYGPSETVKEARVYSGFLPDPRSLLDNLSWRIKRQWHRWFPG
jgi:hypothetical protein